MKLFYYRDLRNFGDALNGWLWPRLIPDLLDEDDTTVFVGIGSLLNEYLPKAPAKVIFGTGVGYGKTQPVVSDKWHIYCVRGPLSAAALGISSDLAVGDSAILLRTVSVPKGQNSLGVSFIPHWRSTRHWNWEAICNAAGLYYINPEWDVERVIAAICDSELVVTEAMHGAVLADAFRVPWIPVRAYKHILTFKWRDYCQSMGLDYRPVRLLPLYSESAISEKVQKILTGRALAMARSDSVFIRALKRGLFAVTGRTTAIFSEIVVKRLLATVRTERPCLSENRVIEDVTERLQRALDRVRADWGSISQKGAT